MPAKVITLPSGAARELRRGRDLRRRRWAEYLAECRAAAPVEYDAAELHAWGRLLCALFELEQAEQRGEL